ncbi:MAG: hypothetical protein K1X89_13995 [Myxococcaceae bacterium]|nr:hypothetical protein [Myxococcaceae bacterium]
MAASAPPSDGSAARSLGSAKRPSPRIFARAVDGAVASSFAQAATCCSSALESASTRITMVRFTVAGAGVMVSGMVASICAAGSR